jgi:hypothetical protein
MFDRAGQFREKHDNCNCEIPQRIIGKERNCKLEPAQGDEQHFDSGALQVHQEEMRNVGLMILDIL